MMTKMGAKISRPSSLKEEKKCCCVSNIFFVLANVKRDDDQNGGEDAVSNIFATLGSAVSNSVSNIFLIMIGL